MIKYKKVFKFGICVGKNGPRERDLEGIEESLNGFLRKYGKRVEIRETKYGGK